MRTDRETVPTRLKQVTVERAHAWGDPLPLKRVLEDLVGCGCEALRGKLAVHMERAILGAMSDGGPSGAGCRPVKDTLLVEATTPSTHVDRSGARVTHS